MKKVYKITASRTIRGEAFVMAECEDEALDLSNETNIVFDDAPDGVLGMDCDDVEIEEGVLPDRISDTPASAVLVSRWDRERKAWIPWELLVKEVEHGLYGLYDSHYEDMEDVIIGKTTYGDKGQYTCNISLATHHCKVVGGHSDCDGIVDEDGVLFTSAGDDITERLGVTEPFPAIGDEPVIGMTDEHYSNTESIGYKMERVMAKPTDIMVEWLVAHPAVSWRLADFDLK